MAERGTVSDVASPFLESVASGSQLAILDEPGWAREQRERSLSAFRTLGLPTRKTEAWKFTDLRALVRQRFDPAPQVEGDFPAPLAAGLAQEPDGSHRIVFVNGRLRADLSRLERLPKGVRVESLAALIAAGDPLAQAHGESPGIHAGPSVERLPLQPANDDNPFRALNTALAADGCVLHVPAGVVVEDPIHLVYLTVAPEQPIAVHPRTMITVDGGGQATVIEVHRGADDAVYFSNASTEIVLADGAVLRHYKWQREGNHAFHLAHLDGRLSRDATYEGFILSTGGALARNEARMDLAGRGCECRLSGAYMGHDRQHHDTTTVVRHAQPNCRSRQVFKGVLDDRARGVYQGRIVVERGAQQTDGYQLSRGLLLSPGAEIDHKPELEIYADDVKCSHGATAGDIDAQALFYLRSRGIGDDEARGMLIRAFLLETLEEIGDENVRQEFAQAVEQWTDGLRRGQ